MIKAQKRDHLATLIEMIEAAGFVQGSYGNYKIEDYRFKVKSINLRFEKKYKFG